MAKKDTVPVNCPRCGYTQPESPLAYSTICQNCQQHYRVQEALHPAPKVAQVVIDQRPVQCFQCGVEFQAPKAAASTMCRQCSAYVDLSDYRITQTLAKSFRTHGWLVLEEKGYLLNTDSRVDTAVLKGRLTGKLVVRDTLEIHSTAIINAQFSAAKLVVPHGQHFRWAEPLRAVAVEVGGELVADLAATGTVWLRATARFFGSVTAAALVVEEGAVFVGSARTGKAV